MAKLWVVDTTDRTHIQLWDSVSGKRLWTWKMPADCAKKLWEVNFTRGPKYLIVEMHSNDSIKEHVFVLDRNTGKQLRSLPGFNIRALSPNGRYVALRVDVGKKSFLQVHDVTTGRIVLSRQFYWGVRGHYACFSPDSKLLACNLVDNYTIEFYDLRTKQRVGPPRQHSAYIRQMVFAPNGKVLAVCYNDSTVVLWEAGFRRDAMRGNNGGRMVKKN